MCFKDMKKSYMAALVLSCCALPANAQQILGGDASISGVTVGKVEDRMFVSMDIAPDGKWNVKPNQSVVLTPRVENDESGIRLPQVLILGRNQYIRHLRNASENAGAQVYKASKTQDIHYEVSVPYEEWMADSRLVLNEDLCGCTKTLLASGENQIERYAAPAFRPVFAYIVPQAEAIKARSKSGQAYVTFPVSETYIDDSYLGNRTELQKIQNTIESVRDDKDVTITGMQLKGYASPEGKYQDNERLAKGRTEAVADYIRNLSDGADYPIATSHEAENWEGLRDFISHSDMPEKEELLAVIDSPAFADDPDGREWKIKSTWPEAYRRLLANCYPFLRRTDYRVEYTVRQFNLEEARALVGSQPQKLSLQEMYNVAQSYEPGSEAYNDVFDTAVRMFPEDETANLNAANSALQQGNTQLAKKYLAKAGNSGEATVARGILAMLEGDAETALSLMEKAQAMGIDAADANIEQIRKLL
jgi:outer membrane protein OmpA-like peptidoglycan-associated protein